MVHLGDVMGAEVVDQFVKSLFVFRAVDFRELIHCFAKFFVQLGSAGHSVAVHSEKPQYENTCKTVAFSFRAREKV